MKVSQITRGVNKSILKTKKNSPHIFFAGGIIASAVSTVLACRATLKLEEVLDDISHNLGEVDRFAGNEYAQEYRRARIDGVVKLVKLYGPTVLTEIVAIGLLSGSHIQMTKRNGALVATLVAAHQGMENYRDKVVEEVGEEKEAHIRRDLTVDKSDWDALTRIFNEENPCYHHDMEINRNFLHFVQNEANYALQKNGVVFLNQVYEMLGFEKTREGFVYGWTYGGDGMSEIDLGLFEAYNARFINGLEHSVILNFNVDGVLNDYI